MNGLHKRKNGWENVYLEFIKTLVLIGWCTL